MKITGKEAYSLMLKDYPDIMNIDELGAALRQQALLKKDKINIHAVLST